MIIQKLKEVIAGRDIKLLKIGCWLWVVGDTYPIKEDLKQLGFFYSNNKKSWFFNGQKHKIPIRAVFKDMDELENKWGYQEITL